jgi:hypothetical protein
MYFLNQRISDNIIEISFIMFLFIIVGCDGQYRGRSPKLGLGGTKWEVVVVGRIQERRRES